MIPRSPPRSSSTWASRKQEEAFFDRIESQGDGDFIWAILDETERHVGFIGLHTIDWRNRSATGGLVIGDRSAWGRGYATDAVAVRTRFAFAQLGLHRINGHTFNPAMKRVYEKSGYRHEGTARPMFWRDGDGTTSSFYGILESDWSGPTSGMIPARVPPWTASQPWGLPHARSPPNYTTLTAMITPALFMTANGSLIISTSNRMSRIVDRIRQLNELADTLSRARQTLIFPPSVSSTSTCSSIS